jgi:hypothetical protein
VYGLALGQLWLWIQTVAAVAYSTSSGVSGAEVADASASPAPSSCQATPPVERQPLALPVGVGAADALLHLLLCLWRQQRLRHPHDLHRQLLAGGHNQRLQASAGGSEGRQAAMCALLGP